MCLGVLAGEGKRRDGGLYTTTLRWGYRPDSARVGSSALQPILVRVCSSVLAPRGAEREVQDSVRGAKCVGQDTESRARTREGEESDESELETAAAPPASELVTTSYGDSFLPSRLDRTTRKLGRLGRHSNVGQPIHH